MSDGEARAESMTIDKTRASKAGHAFHEAWAARTALELLPPSTDLTAITLEGFDEQDEQSLGTGAVEIADLVRYHGATDVARAHRVTVVQFKYSIADADTAVRAADLASTLAKFAETDAELRAAHGSDHVLAVVRYEFATNRPIHENLGKAIAAVLAGTHETGDIARQAGQIVQALKYYPHTTADLLRRLELVGSKGSLTEAERAISTTLAAWSEPGDPDAETRHWSIDGSAAYRAEAWGAEGGRDDYAWSETGYRLFVNREPLLSLLKVSERSLVVVLTLQKYHRGKSSGRAGDTSGFTHRSLLVVIDQQGQVWSPRGLSRQAKNALAMLDSDARHDFYRRFRVIAGLPVK